MLALGTKNFREEIRVAKNLSPCLGNVASFVG